MTKPSARTGTAQLVGASRTIGLALAEELLRRGRRVIGTARDQRQGGGTIGDSGLQFLDYRDQVVPW